MEDLDSAVVLGMAAQAPDGIVITDSEGLIRYWNRGAERIFGFPAADAVGRSLDIIIPERHRKRHQEGFDAAMERGYSKYGDADLLNVCGTGGGRSQAVHRVQRGAAVGARRRQLLRCGHQGRHRAARAGAGADAAAGRGVGLSAHPMVKGP